MVGFTTLKRTANSDKVYPCKNGDGLVDGATIRLPSFFGGPFGMFVSGARCRFFQRQLPLLCGVTLVGTEGRVRAELGVPKIPTKRERWMEL